MGPRKQTFLLWSQSFYGQIDAKDAEENFEPDNVNEMNEMSVKDWYHGIKSPHFKKIDDVLLPENKTESAESELSQKIAAAVQCKNQTVAAKSELFNIRYAERLDLVPKNPQTNKKYLDQWKKGLESWDVALNDAQVALDMLRLESVPLGMNCWQQSNLEQESLISNSASILERLHEELDDSKKTFKQASKNKSSEKTSSAFLSLFSLFSCSAKTEAQLQNTRTANAAPKQMEMRK